MSLHITTLHHVYFRGSCSEISDQVKETTGYLVAEYTSVSKTKTVTYVRFLPTSITVFMTQSLIMSLTRQLLRDSIENHTSTCVQLLNDAIKQLVGSRNMASHAWQVGTKVVLMGKKGIVAQGTPEEIMTEEHLSDIYDVKVRIVNKQTEGSKAFFCEPCFD